MRINRRRALIGLGGITVGLPWLEKLDGKALAQAAPTRPKRVITMTYAMGTPVGQWVPSAPGATFTLPYVTAPLEKFKSRCLFVSGLDHKMLEQGGSGFTFGHPGKQEAALTGTLTAGAFPTNNANNVSEILAMPGTTGGANAASIETVIGKSLFAGHARPSVDLGVDGDQHLNKVASGFCFEGRSAPVSMDCSPLSAFTSLFANLPMGAQADAALAQLKLRNKSVLDAVRDSFADLKVGLGGDDQRRLSEHAARIRQVELDMQAGAVCVPPTGIATPAKMSMDQIAPLQIRVMAQAMGMNVPVLFSATFALGCGLAALGGILAAPMLPIEPMWPLKYLVLVLVIVALAGHGQVTASVAVAVIVGVVETAGRYLFPQSGGFLIYLLLIVLMVWRPDGLLARRRTT